LKKIIFYNTLVFLVIIFTFEILLRFFFNITPQGLSKGIIDENSSKPRFNYSNVEKGKVFGKKVYTDKDGFRISKKNNDKKNNKENIYFIGGSVTFGSGVNQSETFSGILENKLKDLNVFNASVIGSDIENNYYILKNKVSKKNLKKIYINFSLDDIHIQETAQNEKSLKNRNEIFLKEFRNNPILIKLNAFVRSKSVIYVWIKGFIFNAEEGYYIYAHETYKNQKNLNQLEKNLDRLKVYSKEFNDRINFLIIPYSHQIKNNNCNSEDLAEKIIKQEISERKFKFFAVKDLFCENDKKNKIFLNQDPSHLSKYGHQIVADLIEKDLR
tara:strand:+ start:263 stop:1246 length:984 start_codon:yes stop_codon:yes gene_type:complete